MRQSFENSCAGACLLYIMSMLEKRALSTKEEIGLMDQLIEEHSLPRKERLLEVAQSIPGIKELITSHGVQTYKDGVAIAQISCPKFDEPKYVVFLGRAGNLLRLFDPIDGRVHEKNAADVGWDRGEGWTINLNGIKEISIPHRRKTFVIQQEITRENLKLRDTYIDMGKLISTVPCSEIAISKGSLFLAGMAVLPGDDVWIRMPPQKEEEYFSMLRMLVPFEGQVNFINPPSKILSWDEKIIPYCVRNISGAASPEAIPWLRKELESFSVSRMNRDEVRYASTHKGMLDAHLVKTPYVLVHDDGKNDVTNIFWLDGRYVGVIQTGNEDVIELGEYISSQKSEVLSMLTRIGEFLYEKEIVFAAIEIDSDIIRRVNISNPSGFERFLDIEHGFFRDWIDSRNRS